MRKVIAVALALLAAGTLNAQAQSYPSHVITIIVPYPAGGPTDTIARLLAERMQSALGQTIIVENVSGAGGSHRRRPRRARRARRLHARASATCRPT